MVFHSDVCVCDGATVMDFFVLIFVILTIRFNGTSLNSFFSVEKKSL